jgi:hypothetical protein
MRMNWIALLLAALLVTAAQDRISAEQTTQADTVESLGEDVAGIHQSLTRLVDLLETMRDNQRVELIIRRIELKERRLAPLEQRLRSSESREEGIRSEIEEMETMRERIEDDVAEDVRSGRDEMSRENQLMQDEVEMRLQMLTSALERRSKRGNAETTLPCDARRSPFSTRCSKSSWNNEAGHP